MSLPGKLKRLNNYAFNYEIGDEHRVLSTTRLFEGSGRGDYPSGAIRTAEEAEAIILRAELVWNFCLGLSNEALTDITALELLTKAVTTISCIPESARQCLKAAGYDGLTEWIDNLQTMEGELHDTTST